MEANKLFIGSLSFKIGDSELEEIFNTVGTVGSAKVIMDRDTGRSKGFGFVEMSSQEEAEKAIRELNGSTHFDRSIVVSKANKPDGKRSGGSGSRGNFSGGNRNFGGGKGRRDDWR